MNQLRDPLAGRPLPAAAAAHDRPAVRSTILGDYWPGIQIYYPPVKYAPSLGIYETWSRPRSASASTRWNTTAHTLLFDLEDGCRQKEMSRELLRRELPGLPRNEGACRSRCASTRSAPRSTSWT